ncbi:MAG: SGNH/GDSL hydrolase family protein [Spirochaetales bacterium]|jgi:lysophospholipase L1-like esterase|nr:SGNH/GDSL hydrolase family protein [Spirochaetales bacterium]
MKSILCYGDSNTWGFDPATGRRLAYELRWTSILQQLLGPRCNVIPEGLNGRNTCFPDPYVPHRNGMFAFPMILDTHRPIDLIVFMLGTNDTKLVYQKEIVSISRGLRTLIEAARGGGFGPEEGDPAILIVSPPAIIPGNPDEACFDIRECAPGPEKIRLLGEEFSRLAKIMNCYFLDSAPVAPPSPIDGVHLSPESHRALGEFLAGEIARLGF